MIRATISRAPRTKGDVVGSVYIPTNRTPVLVGVALIGDPVEDVEHPKGGIAPPIAFL